MSFGHLHSHRQENKAIASLKKQLSQFELRDVRGLNDRDKKQRGEGSYGVVYEVVVNGVPRIAKQLHKVLLEDDIVPEYKRALFERFYKECELLSTLDHPNIVKFVGIHLGAKSKEFDVSLVMEKLQYDLDKYLTIHSSIPLHGKLSILLDVSKGLLYLHTRNPQIIHRDLSTGNILLTEQMEAKIADFGVSRVLDINPNTLAKQTKCPGTLAYMPPEALLEKPVYGTALDVFSFGEVCLCVIHQTFAQVYSIPPGCPDFPKAHEQGEVEILKRQKWFDAMPANKSLKSIVCSCLQDDPHKRPSTSQLKEDLTDICLEDWKIASEELITLKREVPEMIEGATRERDINFQKMQDQNFQLKNKFEACEQKLNTVLKEKEIIAEQHDLLKIRHTQLIKTSKQLGAELKSLSHSFEQMDQINELTLAKLKETEEGYMIIHRTTYQQDHKPLKSSQSVDDYLYREERIRSGSVPINRSREFKLLSARYPSSGHLSKKSSNDELDELRKVTEKIVGPIQSRDLEATPSENHPRKIQNISH